MNRTAYHEGAQGRSTADSAYRAAACRRTHPAKRRKAGIALSAAVAMLSGCTTLGTNIHGSFTCGAAGDGTCAPATVIDDRALAEITGDTSYRPAGPYQTLPQRAEPQIASAASSRSAPGAPVPSGQKVLRIIYPAHVDGAGRLHEASVVRAVVDEGTWLQAGAAPMQPAPRSASLAPALPAPLANPPSAPPRVATIDPNLPSADAVAAARAKAAAQRQASSQTAAMRGASMAQPAAALRSATAATTPVPLSASGPQQAANAPGSSSSATPATPSTIVAGQLAEAARPTPQLTLPQPVPARPPAVTNRPASFDPRVED